MTKNAVKVGLFSGLCAFCALTALSDGRCVRMSATADYRLSENAHVVSDVRGYNSWPMIQSVGKKA